jgi:hypothetical protein
MKRRGILAVVGVIAFGATTAWANYEYCEGERYGQPTYPGCAWDCHEDWTDRCPTPKGPNEAINQLFPVVPK